MIEAIAGRFELEKEALPVAAGALATAVTDGLVESLWMSNPTYWSNRFPFLGIPPWPDKIPPLDDWLIGLVGPGAAALIGAAVKNIDLMNGGVGGLLYGVPRLVYSTILRNLPQQLPPVTLGAGRPELPAYRGVQSKYVVRG